MRIFLFIKKILTDSYRISQICDFHLFQTYEKESSRNKYIKNIKYTYIYKPAPEYMQCMTLDTSDDH